MEGVEITMTLEIMVDNSPAMAPWKGTALVAETPVDPMVVSGSLQLHIWAMRIQFPSHLTHFLTKSKTVGGYSSGGSGGGGYSSRRY